MKRCILLCSQLSWITFFGCGDSSSPVTPESVATVAPVAPVANDPTITEGPPPVSGGDNALVFDGVDDRVTVPYDPSFPTEVFTVAAWIKLAPPPGRAAIVARGEDDNSFNLSWQLYVLQDGTLEVMLEDSRENNYCYPSNSCAPRGSCTAGELFVANDVGRHNGQEPPLLGRR